MELWLLLILLGLFTYFILKRSVVNITRTPIWALWLVMMAPPLIWCAWTLVYGQKPMPILLVIGPFLVCPILYSVLIQLGRRNFTPSSANDATNTQTPNSDEPEGAGAVGEQSKLSPINQTEESNLRNCFPWSIFYLEKLEYRPQAVLCLGKLRSNPEVAYQTIRENIEGQFGDRFFVLFQESLNGKPFFALVPNPQASKSAESDEGIFRPKLALGLLLVSLFTATIGGAEMAGMTRTSWQANPAALTAGLPYALALLAILGAYGLSQYLTAQYYKIRTTLPYFVPLPPFPFWKWNLGTLGAFVQKRSPIPHRQALFDLAIVGSLASFVVMLPLLLWGLAHSRIISLSTQSGILNFDSLNPRFSLLLSLLSKLALGSQLAPNTAIDLHPVAIAGYIGFIWIAFKLMPVGQLDGGQIVHAMFGLRTRITISQITWLLMLIRALISPDLLIWAIILLFIPLADEPALNDVSELDNRRDFLGLFTLALLVSIILPAPEVLTKLLHI